MIDPKLIRQDPEQIKRILAKRGFEFDVESFNELEGKRKGAQIKTQELQNTRKQLSKQFGQAKAKQEDVTALSAELDKVKNELTALEQLLEGLLEAQDALFMSIPNVLHDSVPLGKSEAENVVLRHWGEPKKFDFEVKDHIELGEQLQQLDFKVASKMSGSRFTVLFGDLARLHRALAQFMLHVQTVEHGYQEVNVPFLVEEKALFNAGQLPKFKDDLFHIAGERKLSLIPTAEVPLANLVADTIVEAHDLPLKFVSHSPCFRSEAGSYGKDTKGLIRQHQFEKVELVQIVAPEQSYQAHEEMTKHAETILQRLELPYRVVNLCSGDVGFCATKTYDLEVWLPGQDCYREISSCSNTESFQARRMLARYRSAAGEKPEFVHTLNGSGLAVGRTLIAVLENYQEKDGKIRIPKALMPYMNNASFLNSD